MNRQLLICIISTLSFIGCQDVLETQSLENINQEDMINKEQYQVSSDIAALIAEKNSYKIDTYDHGPLRSNISKSVKDIYSYKLDSDPATFHIINYEEGGFVVVAGDKRVAPILAYSDDSYFPTDMADWPSGLIGWANDVDALIESVREDIPEPTNRLTKLWDEYQGNLIQIRSIKPDPECEYDGQPASGESRTSQYGPYLTTTWGQGSGYNDALTDMNCREYVNGRPPVGCTSVAVAQVMRYHQKPSSIKWSEMSIGAAVLQNFLSTIGHSLNADYQCSGTEANLADVPALLKQTYGYGSSTLSNFNVNTVISEVSSGFPVIIHSEDSNTNGAHHWVCDGVQLVYFPYCQGEGNNLHIVMTLDSKYLHMNWGWDGLYDGWYNYNAWYPGSHVYDSNKFMLSVRP